MRDGNEWHAGYAVGFLSAVVLGSLWAGCAWLIIHVGA